MKSITASRHSRGMRQKAAAPLSLIVESVEKVIFRKFGGNEFKYLRVGK
jgi:hypothetical protein